MSIRHTIWATAILIAAPVFGAELTEWQVPTRFSYGHSNQLNDSVQAVLETEPALELSLSVHARLVLSGRVWLDGLDRLQPGRPNLDTYSPISRPLALGNAGTAEVRDAYLEFRLDNGLLRIGKQQIVWGRLDGMKVLDILNPQSFREFILDDFDHSRISLWSAYADKSIGDWRMEVAWLPDTSGHEVPGETAWFELTAPRFRYGAQPGQVNPPVRTDRDANGLSDSALGMRISRPIGGIDMSAVAYSGLDFEPLGRINIVDNATVVERFYERRNLYGLNAESSFGPVAVRTEISWQPDRAFNTRTPSALDVVELDQTILAFAVDFNAPLDFFLNLQYVHDRISNAPATLVRPARDRILTAFLRRTFAYDTVEFETRWYKSLEDNDTLLSVAIDYNVDEDTRLRLAAESFSGVRNGLFGQFSDKDRLIFSIEHIF